MTGERRTRPWWARLRLRLPLGVAAGSATAAVELGFLAVATVALAVPGCCPARAHTTGYSRRILAVLRYLGTRRCVPIAWIFRYRGFGVDRHPAARRRSRVVGRGRGVRLRARWGVTGCIRGLESWRAGGRYTR